MGAQMQIKSDLKYQWLPATREGLNDALPLCQHMLYKKVRKCTKICRKSLTRLSLTGLELVKEALLDLGGLLPLCVLPGSLLAHLTVQHGLDRKPI